jgi:hypothetical protein
MEGNFESISGVSQMFGKEDELEGETAELVVHEPGVAEKSPEPEAVKEETQKQEIAADAVDEEKTKTKKPPRAPGKRKKKGYTDYRYRTRMIKGSILPILYGIVSIQLLNRYVYEFPGYYEYETVLILGGFILGFAIMTGLMLVNLIRAKKKQEEGIKLNPTLGVAAFLPFLVILIGLALFEGIATAWQFSTGFFLAPIIPLLIMIFYEMNSKGKFFVREVSDDPSEPRKLVFVS